jgi:hypothetical protein
LQFAHFLSVFQRLFKILYRQNLIRNYFLEFFNLFGVHVFTIGIKVVETGDIFGAFGFEQIDLLEQVVLSFSQFFLVLDVHST